jgi:hypothetical protein
MDEVKVTMENRVLVVTMPKVLQHKMTIKGIEINSD